MPCLREHPLLARTYASKPALTQGPPGAGSDDEGRPLIGEAVVQRWSVAAPILVRMPPVLLRAARPDETEVLFVLHREAELNAYGHIFDRDHYPFPDDAMRDHWCSVMARQGDRTQVTIAEVEGGVVGAVVASPGLLEKLFVVPSHWGAGAGSALHDAALAVTQAAGLASCRLAVLEENHRARRFYEHRGWEPDGRRWSYAFPPHPVELGYTIRLSV